MPNSAQGFKRVRQNLRHRARNKMLRSRLRTSIRRVRGGIAQGEPGEAIARLYKEMVSTTDSSVRKGIIHANQAARIKRQLNRAVRQMSSQG